MLQTSHATNSDAANTLCDKAYEAIGHSVGKYFVLSDDGFACDTYGGYFRGDVTMRKYFRGEIFNEKEHSFSPA